MKVSISVILGFRDRDLTRVQRCLESIAKQSFQDFELIFVDYGSQRSLAEEAKRLIENQPKAQYIYSDTRGKPWNRSQALNIGIQQSKGDYVMTTDIDMIFEPEAFATFMQHASPGRVLHLSPYLLPPGFSDWQNLSQYIGISERDKWSLGACHFAPRLALLDLRGFDEYYCFWGIEDRDLNQRELALGLEIAWMNDVTYMHHQWHPRVDHLTPSFMPDGFWVMLETYYWQHKGQLSRNPSGWGQVVMTHERSIFSHFDDTQSHLIPDSRLEWIDMDPSSNVSISRTLEVLHAMPSQKALVVKQANYPRYHNQVTRILFRANNWLTKRNISTPLAYQSNKLHGGIYSFIHLDRGTTVKDYYLNFPYEAGISIIVKN